MTPTTPNRGRAPVLLALTVLYGGLFLTSGCSSKPKGTPDSPIEVSAVDLFKEYKDNKEEADKKYLNKTLEVTGILVGTVPWDGEFQLRGDPTSTRVVWAGDGTSINVIVGKSKEAEAEKAKMLELKPGQEITVRGQCDVTMYRNSSYGWNIRLIQPIVLVKAQPYTPPANVDAPQASKPAPPPPPKVTDEKEAIANLKKLGITVEPDGQGKIRELYLNKSKNADKALVNVWAFPNLETLDLTSANVTDAGLASLEGLKGLKRLTLTNTRITDRGLASLQGLTGLEELNMADTKATDKGMVHLKGLTNLVRFVPALNAIGDEGLKNFAGMTKLQYLHLAKCPKITDAGLESLKNLTELETLILDDMPLGDAGLAHLQKLTKLKKLDMYGCKVTDAGLANLKGMTSLESLDVRGGKVTAAGAAALKKVLPKCEIRN